MVWDPDWAVGASKNALKYLRANATQHQQKLSNVHPMNGLLVRRHHKFLPLALCWQFGVRKWFDAPRPRRYLFNFMNPIGW